MGRSTLCGRNWYHTGQVADKPVQAGAGAALKDADLIALLGPLHSTSIKVSLPGARVQRNVTSGTAAAEECMGESRSHEAADTTADGGAAAKQLTRVQLATPSPCYCTWMDSCRGTSGDEVG